MTRRCWGAPVYYISLPKWRDYPDGGGTNFMVTRRASRAWMQVKKLKVKHRQIDVRDSRLPRGKSPYVLRGSWK